LRAKLPFEIWPSHEAIIRLAASALSLPDLTIRDMIRVFHIYLKIIDLPEYKNFLSRRRLWKHLSDSAMQKAKKQKP